MAVVAVTDLPADGWDAAPLISARRARGRVSRRRDLRRLDPDFLTNQLDEAWPGYLATYYARNRSIGSVLFDREDVEAELRLLLVEAATRFDASRGSGSFVAWACSQQRAHLIDISRRRMGRSVSDAAIQASRGVDIPEQMKRDIAAFHSLARPVPIDVAFGPDSRPLTETLADLSKPSVEDIAMTIDQCSRCDAVDECVARLQPAAGTDIPHQDRPGR